MIFRKLCTALSLTALLAIPSLCLAETTGNAQETTPTQKVVLTLGSNNALLNNAPYQLEIPPEVVEGTTFLPVRFVAEEVLGLAVKWDSINKVIELANGEVQVKLSLETGQALVNDQEVEIISPPFIKDGRTLVPLRFLAENLDMQIEYNPTDKTITIIKVTEEPAPINLPPVITSLGLQSDVIKIGEVPRYNFTYENEVEEDIVAEEWSCQFTGNNRIISGQPRAFFQSGEYILSLRIKDASEKWSETATTRFTVSDEKLMSEMEFKFSEPIYGELYENVENVNFNFFAANDQVTFERTGPLLHMSNSPEVVAQPGILYQSEASDDFRLFYHHLNGSTERQYLYVIAENNGTKPVTLKTLKSGVGGPTNDYMTLGQTVTMRYLPSKPSASITIKPGEKIILNPGLRHLNKGEAVTGMQDFQADGTITISVIMGPEKAPEPEPGLEPKQGESITTPGNTQKDGLEVEPENVSEPDPTNDSTNNSDASNNSASEIDADSIEDEDSEPAPVKTPEQILKEKIEYLLSLPFLPRHPQQIRGVFPDGDCLINIQADNGDREKITLGKEDPGYDTWVEGVDPLTGDIIRSFGNYGVIYRVKISSPVKTGILLNPRGSIFKGAFQGFDGNVYKAPEANHFTGLQRAAVLGVLEAGQTAEFTYTPPSGSDTPIIITLIPEKFWETSGE